MDTTAQYELGKFWNTYLNYKVSPPHPPNPLRGDWVKYHSGLPWLKLQLPFPIDWAKILEEIKGVDHLFVSHREKGGHSGWSSLVLHGLKPEWTESYEAYGYNEEPYNEYHWTEICEHLPYTTNLFKNVFPYKRYFRLRLMRLSPGGYILPHRDDHWSHLGPLNISVNQPSGCEMVMENGGTVPFTDKSAFSLDISRLHSVWNRSDENRYHIIVHGDVDEQWDEILVNSFRAQTENTTIAATHGEKFYEFSWNFLRKFDESLRFFTVFQTGKFIDLDAVKGSGDPVRILNNYFENIQSKQVNIIEIPDGEFYEFINQDKDAIYCYLGDTEGVTIEYKRDLVYDEEELPSDHIFEKIQLNEGEFFYVNPKDFAEILNRGEGSGTLIQVLPPFRLIADLRADALLNDRLGAGHIAGALCLEVAKKGYHLPTGLMNSWRLEGIKSSLMRNQFKTVILTQTGTDSKTEHQLIYKDLIPSLSPLEIDLVKEEHLSEYLANRSDLNEKIIILYPGCYVKDIYEFSYEVVKQFAEMRRCKVPLSGHIMDWGDDRLPYLHEQFTMVDMSSYNAHAKTAWVAKGRSVEFPRYEATNEKFHDHYTPHKLIPTPGERLKGQANWGSLILSSILKANQSVWNISEEIRNCKIYSYPGGDDRLGEFKIRMDITRKIEERNSELFILNNMPFVFQNLTDFCPDHILTVASGLRHLKAAKHFESTHVTLIDLSYRALEFWRLFHSLQRESDLDDLLEVFSENSHFNRNDLLEELNIFVRDSFSGKIEQFFSFLGHLNFDYRFGDFLESPEIAVQLIPRDQKTLFMVSNCYEYHPNSFLFSNAETKKSFEKLNSLISRELGIKMKLAEKHFQAFGWDHNNEMKIAIIDENRPT